MEVGSGDGTPCVVVTAWVLADSVEMSGEQLEGGDLAKDIVGNMEATSESIWKLLDVNQLLEGVWAERDQIDMVRVGTPSVVKCGFQMGELLLVQFQNIAKDVLKRRGSRFLGGKHSVNLEN